jgi:hypothetical protein
LGRADEDRLGRDRSDRDFAANRPQGGLAGAPSISRARSKRHGASRR